MYDIHMESEFEHLDFTWDERKAESNARKHGVTFQEASEVFEDRFGRVIDDPDHSLEEQRFIIIGMSISARVLTVVHCIRAAGSIVRIISARRATKNEEGQYWRQRR